MEIGKLYKSKNNGIIVKCLGISVNDDFFLAEVMSDNTIHEVGFISNFICDNFEEYNESPTTNQIGGNHYKDLKIQPTDFIHANNIPFIEGNIIKYVVRHKSKNGIEDLKKAKHYIDLLIQFEYEASKGF